MQIPESIAVRCLAGREPFPGNLGRAHSGMRGGGTKTALSFVFGPTREDGRLFPAPRGTCSPRPVTSTKGVGLDYETSRSAGTVEAGFRSPGAAELRHQLRLTFVKSPAQAGLDAPSRRGSSAALPERARGRAASRSRSRASCRKRWRSIWRRPGRGDWLPESLYEPVQKLLSRLCAT